ncbi:Mucin-like protein [Giardia lamblia P15]|uniref:Mucin-like protein n=1 Tax=Giardia intestinalis (strain P15) TaxID=658858 RepID=E1EZ68_GIAIA|nr:Mucin-like protein [Giardia lamblia P15]
MFPDSSMRTGGRSRPQAVLRLSTPKTDAMRTSRRDSGPTSGGRLVTNTSAMSAQTGTKFTYKSPYLQANPLLMSADLSRKQMHKPRKDVSYKTARTYNPAPLRRTETAKNILTDIIPLWDSLDVCIEERNLAYERLDANRAEIPTYINKLRTLLDLREAYLISVQEYESAFSSIESALKGGKGSRKSLANDLLLLRSSIVSIVSVVNAARVICEKPVSFNPLRTGFSQKSPNYLMRIKKKGFNQVDFAVMFTVLKYNKSQALSDHKTLLSSFYSMWDGVKDEEFSSQNDNTHTPAACVMLPGVDITSPINDFASLALLLGVAPPMTFAFDGDDLGVRWVEHLEQVRGPSMGKVPLPCLELTTEEVFTALAVERTTIDQLTDLMRQASKGDCGIVAVPPLSTSDMLDVYDRIFTQDDEGSNKIILLRRLTDGDDESIVPHRQSSAIAHTERSTDDDRRSSSDAPVFDETFQSEQANFISKEHFSTHASSRPLSGSSGAPTILPPLKTSPDITLPQSDEHELQLEPSGSISPAVIASQPEVIADLPTIEMDGNDPHEDAPMVNLSPPKDEESLEMQALAHSSISSTQNLSTYDEQSYHEEPDIIEPEMVDPSSVVSNEDLDIPSEDPYAEFNARPPSSSTNAEDLTIISPATVLIPKISECTLLPPSTATEIASREDLTSTNTITISSPRNIPSTGESLLREIDLLHNVNEHPKSQADINDEYIPCVVITSSHFDKITTSQVRSSSTGRYTCLDSTDYEDSSAAKHFQAYEVDDEHTCDNIVLLSRIREDVLDEPYSTPLTDFTRPDGTPLLRSRNRKEPESIDLQQLTANKGYSSLPTKKQTEKPAEQPEAPIEEPVEEQPAEQPEAPIEEPEEPVEEQPAEQPEAPIEEPVEEQPAEQPEAPTEEPEEPVEEQPAEQPEAPTEEPVEELLVANDIHEEMFTPSCDNEEVPVSELVLTYSLSSLPPLRKTKLADASGADQEKPLAEDVVREGALLNTDVYGNADSSYDILIENFMHSHNKAENNSLSRPLTHESSFLVKHSSHEAPKQNTQDQYSSIAQEHAGEYPQVLSSTSLGSGGRSSIYSTSSAEGVLDEDVVVTQMILTFTADSHVVENPHHRTLSADQSATNTTNLENKSFDKSFQDHTTVLDSLMDISETPAVPSTTQFSRPISAQSITVPEVTMTFATTKEPGLASSDSSKGFCPQPASPAHVITLSRSTIKRAHKPLDFPDEPGHESRLDEFETCDLLAEQLEETYEETHSPSDSLVMDSSKRSKISSCEQPQPEHALEELIPHQSVPHVPISSNELLKQTPPAAPVTDEVKQMTSPSIPPTKEYRATVIRKPKPTVWSKEPSISRRSVPSTPYTINDYTAAQTFIETVPFAANASILGTAPGISANLVFPDLPPPQFSNYTQVHEDNLSILEEMNMADGLISSKVLPAVSISRSHSTIPQHSNDYLLSRAFTPVDVIGEDVTGLVHHINTIPTTLEKSIVKALPSVRVSHARHASIGLEGFPRSLAEFHTSSQNSIYPLQAPNGTAEAAISALPTQRSTLPTEESHLQLEDLEAPALIQSTEEPRLSNYVQQMHNSAPTLPLRSASVTLSIIEEMYADQGSQAIATMPLETSIIDELYSTNNLSTTIKPEQPALLLNHVSLPATIQPQHKDELISDFLAEQSIVQIIPGSIDASKHERQDSFSAALYETTTNIDTILTPNSPVVVSTIELPLPTFTEPALSSLTVLPPVETMLARSFRSPKLAPKSAEYLEKTPAPDDISHDTSSYLPTEGSKMDPPDLYVTQDLFACTAMTGQSATVARGSIPVAEPDSSTQATDHLTALSNSSTVPPNQRHQTRSPSISLEPASFIKHFSKEPSSSSRRSLKLEETEIQVQELNMSWTKNSEQHKAAVTTREHHSPAKIQHARLPPRARSLEKEKPSSEPASETSYKPVGTPSIESSTAHELAAPQVNSRITLDDPLPQDLTIGPISSYHTDYSIHRTSAPTEAESKLDMGLFSEAHQSISDHPSRFRDPEQVSIHTTLDDILSARSGEQSAIHASATQAVSRQELSASKDRLAGSVFSGSNSCQWNDQLASSVVRRDKQLSRDPHHNSSNDLRVFHAGTKELSHRDNSNSGTSRIASSVLQNIARIPSESDTITVSINQRRAGPRQAKKQSIHQNNTKKDSFHHEDGEIECAEVVNPQPQSEATDLPVTGRKQRR